jgi:hypothetical protein
MGPGSIENCEVCALSQKVPEWKLEVERTAHRLKELLLSTGYFDTPSP